MIFLRHTKTLVGENVCYGDQNVELAESFADEYDIINQYMPVFDRIISSPLSRCRLLASELAIDCHTPLKFDAALTEMNFGSWQGLPWDEIPRHEMDEWAAHYEYAKPHGGESVKDLRLRAWKMLQGLDNKPRTLLVTHAGFIRAALTMLYACCDKQKDEQKDERDIKVGYGEFVEYQVSPINGE